MAPRADHDVSIYKLPLSSLRLSMWLYSISPTPAAHKISIRRVFASPISGFLFVLICFIAASMISRSVFILGIIFLLQGGDCGGTSLFWRGALTLCKYVAGWREFGGAAFGRRTVADQRQPSRDTGV